MMNILLWLLQILLGVLFLYSGTLHFIIPPGLPPQMAWMYELPTGLHYFSGTAEILIGLGLILPGLTRIQTRLTPLAALGLVVVMAGAAVWQLTRSAYADVLGNIILMGLAGFVAYGRWKFSPLKDKGST
ncbi:MAG: DoxX family protein [Caldilineaceae bacterium]|nr:DoxX family protein [Caldilineaceae bacterium]MBP8107955.1 DoxX family protein [Caldilineaceae bacterium]MBP8122977.1 DoxX family protein [Caldilineaceae bacterium]MBP9073028.1 DoxX family protein [Caldilineaceae bacterium]